MFNIQKLKYNGLKLKRHLNERWQEWLEQTFQKTVCQGKDQILLWHRANYILTSQRQALLNKIKEEQRPVIFFVFRDYQMLDWFTPIHQALLREYSERYPVLYLNYGSTLSRVGCGVAYLSYLRHIEKRLDTAGISNIFHLSDREIPLFKNFPSPSLIVTSETIRHEQFDCQQRVYLPHYSVPKAKDSLNIKLRFNHLFLPARSPYTYTDLNFESTDYQVHTVGYPKIRNDLSQRKTRLFENEQPTLIYAPSLEADVILGALNDGILDIFKELTTCNILIKLHPTLANKMFNIYQLIIRQVRNFPHIKVDTRSNIQDIGGDTDLMITDFGSVGAEYKLRFGKRLIYLTVPDYLAGGGDLAFRDRFADEITPVANLREKINQTLALGAMDECEQQMMGETVLYHYNDADNAAAKAIQAILEVPQKTV